MKKLWIVLISVLLLTGCMSSKSDDLKSFKDYNSKKTSYNLKGSMSIMSNEDKFTYDIDVAVKNNKYYKVVLTNTINNHVQVILKNETGVYVVTPNLNKSFKFQSEWPSNSSQAYLLESLIADINNDSTSTISETKEGYTIEAKVNYPNNAKMDNEIITTDKDFNVKGVDVMDVDGNVLLKVEVKDINYKPKFNDDYFDLEMETEEKYNDAEKQKIEDCMSKCTTNECKNSCEKTKETGKVLEDIVYPLYVPQDTYLSSKDKVSTDDGNRVILTFAGTDPFILVEEAAKKNSELVITPVSGEPLMMSSTVGALTSNSLYFTNNGIDYYINSNTLDSAEMMMVAESIANGSTLVASVK